MTAKPFETFISQALVDFESYLKKVGMTPGTITERMKGAREFGRWLTGNPHRYRERTKGTI